MSGPTKKRDPLTETRALLESACRELRATEESDRLAFARKKGPLRRKAFAASYAYYFRTGIGELALEFLAANKPEEALHLLARSFAQDLPETIRRAAEYHVLVGHRQRGSAEQFREKIYRYHVVCDRIAELREINPRLFKSEARCLRKILEEATSASPDDAFRRIVFPKALLDLADFERWYRRVKSEYKEFVAIGDK